MRKFFVAIWTIGGIALFGIVHARTVPGWDEPYNPPAYYSPTEISYEDSSSPFALWDLEQQGGEVYDPARELEHIKVVANLIDWMGRTLDNLGLNILNSTPQNEVSLEATADDIAILNEDTQEHWKNQAADDLLSKDSGLLRTLDNYDDDKEYDRLAAYQKAEEAYTAYAESARAILATQDREQELLDRILDGNANAAGELQEAQLQAQIEAMQSAENSRRNMLLSNLSSVKAMEKAIQADEEIERDRNVNAAQLRIQDPYHPTEFEKRQYERPEGKGFVRF